ncbi:MAG: hypothetical protein AB8B64_05890 [Granulosicoccus sp.]
MNALTLITSVCSWSVSAVFLLNVPVLCAEPSGQLPDDVYECLITPIGWLIVGSPSLDIIDQELVEPVEVVSQRQAFVELNAASQQANLELAKIRVEKQREVIWRKIELVIAQRDTRRLSDLFAILSLDNQEHAIPPSQEYRISITNYEITQGSSFEAKSASQRSVGEESRVAPMFLEVATNGK